MRSLLDWSEQSSPYSVPNFRVFSAMWGSRTFIYTVDTQDEPARIFLTTQLGIQRSSTIIGFYKTELAAREAAEEHLRSVL